MVKWINYEEQITNTYDIVMFSLYARSFVFLNKFKVFKSEIKEKKSRI